MDENKKSIFLREIENQTANSNPQNSAEKISNSQNSQNQNFGAENSNPQNSNFKKPQKKTSAIAIFATMILSFLFLIALFIFTMSVGGAGNPILKTFGIPEDGVKNFLLELVNFSFAGFAIILLLSFAFSFFGAISASEKIKKSARFIFSAVSIGLLFLVILVWLGMWRFVNAFVVEISPADAKILIDVPNAEKIVAPLDATFSAEKIQKAIENKGFKIEGFRWDFGDGNFQPLRSENSVIHHFETSGKFIVRVEVVTRGGETQIFRREFKIDRAAFSAEPKAGNAPLRVEFDAERISQNLDAVSFDWDFNDGEQKSTPNAKIAHTFEKIGKYKVKLRILNSDGNVKLFSETIEVRGENAEKIQAKIKIYPEEIGNAPQKIHFDGAESFSTDGEIIFYEWDFGDGSAKIKGVEADHIFEKPGEYFVKLKIRDEFETEKTNEIKIQIKNPIENLAAEISTNPKMQNGILRGDAPFFVEFDASKSSGNAVEFKWDFDGDGEFDSTGSATSFTFRDEINSKIILKIIDAAGEENEIEIPIEISKQKIGAQISADSENGVVPLIIKFNAAESWCDFENCKIASFEWDFGDDSEPQISGAQISHRFDRVGIFEVKLKVHTNSGETAETSKKIFVREIPLVSCFESSRKSGTAPLTVSFDPSCANGPIENWKWDFGDGVVSQTRRATHTFQKSGEFEVILQIFDEKNNVAEFSEIILVK